jgi:arylsulfatase A-like enzyme
MVCKSDYHNDDTLNFVVIMCDTLRYDHIGFLGNDSVQTPNIDAFAANAQVFDHAYAGSFPTVPNRSEIFTSRYVFSYLGWEDLPDDEIVLAKTMGDAGYTTGIIFDTMHIRNQFTLDREFDSWRWIRGQGNDRYRAVPLEPELPASPNKFRHGEEVVSQYLRNVSKRYNEEDYFMAQMVNAAKAWLRNVCSQNKFYLHIDMFDPHEPWDPVQSYVDLYAPNYEGEKIIYPAYAPADYFDEAELAYAQALYAAEVTMVDHWLGELFSEIRALGLWDNTVVILTSDHGILLGEHNAVGKSWDHQNQYECYPLYQELAHIPMLVRVPGAAPKRIPSLVQPTDIMPSLLDWAGVRQPRSVQGHSFRPMIDDSGESPIDAVRNIAVTSRSFKLSLSTSPSVVINSGEWSYVYGGGHTSSALYYLPDDPGQENNLLNDHRDVACSLHAAFVDFLESIGTSEEYLANWRYSPC